MGGSLHDAWFEALVARYGDRLVWFIAGMLGDEQHARDVAQETFVAAWRARRLESPPFAGEPEELGARRWLYRVAYNRAVSLLRQRKRVGMESLDGLLDADEARFYVPTPFEDRVLEAETLRAALASLDPSDAAAVLLHVVHGFTAGEIATILDVSLAAATKRVWRAKERLRAVYFAQEARRAPGAPLRGQAHT